MPIENKHDEKQIKNRFLELAKRSYEQNMYTFTGFLGLTEQSLFFDVEKEVSSVGYTIDGGNPLCDRKIVRFGKIDELGYEEEFPIACIKITPLIKKFSDEDGEKLKKYLASGGKLILIGKCCDKIEKIYETHTNFVFMKVKNAKQVFDKMKENSIIIRNMGDYLRITAGSKEENEKMLETFKKVLEEV